MNNANVGPINAVNAIRSETAKEHSSRIQFVDGREYAAEVVSFADGQIVLVRVQDSLLNMKLGNHLAPGQMITLKYVAGHAVPTFTLVPSDTAEVESGHVALSRAGTVIGQYLQEVEEVRLYDQAVSTKLPLLSNPSNSEQSAKELQQSIMYSGLFYESHQANFARGQETIENLLKEPQNQEDFNPSEMVAKQLEIIEKNTIKWSGTVWPGQLMRWTTHLVSERSDSGEHADSSGIGQPAAMDITSRLELSLPKLKNVIAHFTLSGESLSLNIEVTDPDALHLMQSELSPLISAINATDSTLAYCLIKQHE